MMLISSHSFANETSKLRELNWKEISHKDGITVFKPESFDHSSGLVPIRFMATLNYDIAKVLSVLADESRKLEWIPNLEEIKLIEKKSIQDFTVYYRYDAPWPFKDRDFVIKNQGVFDPEKFMVSVDLKSVSSSKVNLMNHTVRGRTFDGYSIIREDPTGKTIVEMAFLNEFGGMIPSFVVNIVQKSWPYKFMAQLRGQLSKSNIEILPEFKIKRKKK